MNFFGINDDKEEKESPAQQTADNNSKNEKQKKGFPLKAFNTLRKKKGEDFGSIQKIDMQDHHENDESKEGEVEDQIDAGDYLIHVFIEQAKRLNISQRKEIIPQINIPQLKLLKYASAKADQSSISGTTWNEHIFLEAKNAGVSDLQDSRIQVTIQERTQLQKVKQVGQYEFSLERIYQNTDHCIKHQWVALTDTSEESKSTSEIVGYLKIGIQITGKHDKVVEIKEEEEDVELSELATDQIVIIPAHIQPQYAQVTMRFFIAEDLPTLDLGTFRDRFVKNTMDGYVKLRFAGYEFKTKVVTKQENENQITWNQEITFAVQLPLLYNNLKIQIWDENKQADDTCMGSLPFKMTNIINKTYNEPAWHNIYGSPVNNPDQEEEVADMNLNPQCASKWKGRLLLQIVWEEQETAHFNIETIKKEDIDVAQKKLLNRKNVQVVFSVAQAIALPAAEKYKVGLFVNEKEIITKSARNEAEQDGGMNLWAETITATFDLPIENIKQVGTMFLYLIKEESPTERHCISYMRLKPQKFNKEKPEWQFSQMTVDPCINMIQNKQDGGIIQWRCYIKLSDVPQPSGPKSADQKALAEELKEMKTTMEPKIIRRCKAYKIRAYIYQCKHLTAADDNGMSDPYVQVWDKEKQNTATDAVECSLNPVFYEAIDINYDVFISSEEAKDIQRLVQNFPPVILDLFDKDGGILSTTSDYLSRATIFLKDSSCRFIESQTYEVLYESPLAKKVSQIDQSEGNKKMTALARTKTMVEFMKSQQPKMAVVSEQMMENHKNNKDITNKPSNPHWHTLHEYQDGPKEGEILVSFDITEMDHVFEPKIPKELRFQDFINMAKVQFEINILGLRELQSMGILPVKKATVHFDFKQLTSSEEEQQSIQNKQTDAGPSGANPTLNTMLKCLIKLPIDRKLCPTLQCIVKDNIFAGRFQPTIGQFTIELGSILFDKNENFQHDINQLKLIAQGLKKRSQEFQIPDYCQHLHEKIDEKAITEVRKKDRKQAKTVKEKIKRQIDKNDDGEALIGLLSEPSRVTKSVVNKSECPDTHDEHDGEHQFHQMVEGFEREKFEDLDFQIISTYNEELLKKLHLAKKDKTFDHEDRKDMVDQFIINERIKKNPDLADLLGKMELQALKHKQEEQKKSRSAADVRRKEAEDKFEQEHFERSQRIVLTPIYKADERLGVEVETEIPPKELYMPCGHDPFIGSNQKHYRKYYDQELEKTASIMSKRPFEKYLIKSGNAKAAKDKQKGLGILRRAKEKKVESANHSKIMGYLKGIVNVYSEDMRKDQIEQKEKYEDLIFHELKKFQIDHNSKCTDEGHKLDTLSKLSLKNEEGRTSFRRQMFELKLGHLNILKHLMDVESEQIIKNMLMIRTKCFVFLHVLTGYHLASRDMGSESDPFLIVELGKLEKNYRDEYQTDQPNPDFYKSIKLSAEFPGCSNLTIRVMDMDEIFGDDEIGTTIIDLEDRFYSHQWQAVPNKPIETRPLLHPSSSRNQGYVRCWVDIIPNHQETSYHYWDITPSPVQELEVRVVVYKTKDLKKMDIEGCNDVFFKGFFDPQEDQDTDIHYRCFDGKAQFNYRLLFPYFVKKENTRKFTLQGFDKDLLTSNDLIGEVELDMDELIKDTCQTKRSCHLSKEYYNKHLKGYKQWAELNLKFKDDYKFYAELKDKEGEVTGKVLLQIDVVTKKEQKQCPLGLGRNQPNQNPFLPDPEGRMQLTMNPRKIVLQLIGEDNVAKMKASFWLLLCIVITIYMLPQIIGNMIAKSLT